MYKLSHRLLVALAVGACSAPSETAPTAAAEPAVAPAPVPAIETQNPVANETLRLATVTSSDSQLVVDVLYAPRAEQPGPRAVELHLRASPSLTYVSGSALEAASRAGKQLVVQGADTGALRVLLYGTGSLDRIAAGALCRLTFSRAPGQPATLELQPHMPVFAPAEANDGVLLGGPLTVGGGTP